MSDPGRSREDEDVGNQDLLTDLRPLVAVTHVGFDAGTDVEIDHPHRAVGSAVLRQGVEHDVGEVLSAGLGGRRLERAVERDRAQGCLSHGASQSVTASPVAGLDIRRARRPGAWSTWPDA